MPLSQTPKNIDPDGTGVKKQNEPKCVNFGLKRWHTYTHAKTHSHNKADVDHNPETYEENKLTLSSTVWSQGYSNNGW